jgi:Rho guanine nucleotide exchange factor 7
MKNAFEITGPMIEKIVAICQGPSDANKWVEYLTVNGTTTSTKTVDILKRQRSGFELKRNASTSSAVTIPQPPPHVSIEIY